MFSHPFCLQFSPYDCTIVDAQLVPDVPFAHTTTLATSCVFVTATHSDPDFLLPEDYEKLKWEKICEEGAQVQEITA